MHLHSENTTSYSESTDMKKIYSVPNIRPLDPAKNNLRTLQFSEIFLPLVNYRQIINQSSTGRNSMSINIYFILICVFQIELAVARQGKHQGNHQPTDKHSLIQFTQSA